MYKDQNVKKSCEDNNSEDDFDFNLETGQKFGIKWSPSEEIKFISKHRFIGNRPLSRSVPRRKRGLFQYKINRSLNFEIGTPRHETVFKSPNFDSDDSPICNEKYLTRSAKILRSLNINFSPSRTRNKRINKTLNFDLSPSPKRIFSSSESLCNKESPGLNSNSKRMSKINKTLNFSSSSNASNFSSYLGSSVDSIDENQNQTPSHRNRSVKKSLNYLTPSPKLKANISRPVNKSPISREQFINNLKYNAETPEFRDIKQSDKKHFDGISVSTPRNLFQDFGDEDKEMRPATPENVVQFVPESMSAIKKSHKKERQSNRSEKLYAHQLREYCNQTDNSSEAAILFPHSDERPATPITNDSYPSPNYSVSSIKQSHKKDKSKKKSAVVHSEDEISDSGSIFDYTELMEDKREPSNQSRDNLSPLSSSSSGFGIISYKDESEKRSTCLDNSLEQLSDQGSIFDYSETAAAKTASKLENSPNKIGGAQDQAKDKEPLKLSFDRLELISPVKAETSRESGSMNPRENEGRPVTPENIINVLDQVMSDSIKKSHKKIKDKNKKTLIKPQASVQEPTIELPRSNTSQRDEDCLQTGGNRRTPENIARAGTPENVNSSRLLLGQFSSVKKSHKKNKHKKIVTESAKRQRYFNNDSKDSCQVSGVKTLSPQSQSLGTSNEFTTEIETCSKTPDKRSIQFSTTDESPLERSTPNKRKKSFSLVETAAGTSSVDSSNVEYSSMDYESAEEEFKIFTPIKKRRSLRGSDDTEGLRSNGSNVETSHSVAPTQEGSIGSIDDSFTTPNSSKDFVADKESKSGDTNGRSTPQNRSTSEMIFDINSIKKSHKKDKRNSRLRRTLNTDEDKNDFRVIKVEEVFGEQKPSIVDHRTETPNDSISENDFDNPRPSTSFSNKNTEATTTPPNCSKVINYLKLRQADSIKRSHKKIREQKKQIINVDDAELSDDGSIFDSSDRIGSNEVDDNTASQLFPQTPPNTSKMLIQIESIKKSHKKVREFKRQGVRDVAGADMSDDGSIFDPEERLDESLNDVEKIESSRESTPSK